MTECNHKLGIAVGVFCFAVLAGPFLMLSHAGTLVAPASQELAWQIAMLIEGCVSGGISALVGYGVARKSRRALIATGIALIPLVAFLIWFFLPVLTEN